MKEALNEAIKVLNEVAEQAAEILENFLEQAEIKVIDLDAILLPVNHNFPEPIPIKVNAMPLGRYKSIYHCRNNC